MTARRHRQHPSDFGRASTFVETVDLPELAEPSIQFLEAVDYYGLVELEYKQDPRDGTLQAAGRQRADLGLSHARAVKRGSTSPTSSTATSSGCRWNPCARATGRPLGPPGHRRAQRRRRHPAVGRGSVTTARTLRGIDTEAVFSLRDPLPGLYELRPAPLPRGEARAVMPGPHRPRVPDVHLLASVPFFDYMRVPYRRVRPPRRLAPRPSIGRVHSRPPDETSPTTLWWWSRDGHPRRGDVAPAASGSGTSGSSARCPASPDADDRGWPTTGRVASRPDRHRRHQPSLGLANARAASTAVRPVAR